MSDIDKQALADAVNELIESADAKRVFTQLMGVFELAAKEVPVRLTSRLAVLNPLLELMLADFDRADRVLDLIDRKRMEFERVHAARWQAVRQEREDDARKRKESRLTVDERTAIIAQLWADVDAELNALEDYVQSELRKPATARGAGFEFWLRPRKENR